MAQKPQAHPSLNQQEYIIAGITGVGLLLAILAGMLAAFDIAPDGILGLTLTSYLIIGAVLMAIGLIMWLTMLRPWEKFDDLKTPYYTGHDHAHEEHDEEDHGDPKSMPALVDLSLSDTVTNPEIDDLEIIEGIGAKVKEALVAAGISSFAALAETSSSDLQKILDDAGQKLPKPDTWAKQAQYVVNGDLQGFEGYKRLISKGSEDLTKVEGIGPKVRDALAKAGIETFAELAATNVEALQKILDDNGLKLQKPGTWTKQAQYVVDGDIAGLEAYQAKLHGGVEKE